MADLDGRIAGAPITWGVDGSPGWGHLMDRDRVMTEMSQVGLSATELGPDGYLPRDPAELREYVGRYGMQLVGGFVHAVLHIQDRFEADLEYFDNVSRQLAAGGAEVLVVGANSGLDGYDVPVELSDAEWQVLSLNLPRLQDIVTSNGLTTAVHPHWGMAIAGQRDVERLLELSDVDLCLDTGHLYIAGADPVEIARQATGRVVHVHAKDVDATLAEQVRTGEITFKQATLQGMFTAVGDGDVDIAGVIEVLEESGYRGWYVLEQDVSLTEDPAPGAGPMLDAEKSVRYLASQTSV